MLQTLELDEENEVDVEDCDQCSQYFYTTEDLKLHKKNTTTIYEICRDNSPELEYCLAAGQFDGPDLPKSGKS